MFTEKKIIILSTCCRMLISRAYAEVISARELVNGCRAFH